MNVDAGFRTVFLIGGILMGAHRVGAQKVGLGFVAGSTEAFKFQNARGAGLYVQPGSSGLRLQFQFLQRSNEASGIACGGYVPPGMCATERIRDRTRAWAAGFGWYVGVLDRGHWQLGVPVDVMASFIRGTTTGLESGRRIEADGRFIELGLGPEVGFQPTAAGPWSFRVRGSRRGGFSLFNVRCDDCHEPYQEGYGSWVAYVSLEYAWTR